MNTRSRNTIALLAIGVLASATVVIVTHITQRSRSRASSREWVPDNASAVLTVRLDRLRASPLGQLLADTTEKSASGALRSTCSRDLLDRISNVTLWTTDSAAIDFALAAVGNIHVEEWEACAKTIVAARGGQLRISQSRGFHWLQDISSSGGSALVALREGGPVLVGQESLLSLTTNGQHRDRAENRAGHENGADLELDVRVGERLRAWFDEVTDLPDKRTLRVSGLSATLNLGSPLTHLRALVRCENGADCDRLSRTLNDLRARARESVGGRAAGIASVLEDATIRLDDHLLWLECRARTDDVLGLIRRIGRWEESVEQAPGRIPPARVSGPEEILRVGPTDGGAR